MRGSSRGSAVVARLALLGGLAMGSGCLVDDPPPYRAPQQTAPRISGLRALPRLNQVITYAANSTEPVEFAVPITSEDAGQEIEGRLYRNYEGPISELVDLADMPASTLDEGERTLRLTWFPRPDLQPGCHRITLRVSHQGNWYGAAELFDASDLDEAYWFANVFVDAQNLNSLVDCPSTSSSAP